jgi:hypothetical protein
MNKWLKDILPDKDPYHNRGRDQMRKKGGPEFECSGIEMLHKICSTNHVVHDTPANYCTFAVV